VLVPEKEGGGGVSGQERSARVPGRVGSLVKGGVCVRRRSKDSQLSREQMRIEENACAEKKKVEEKGHFNHGEEPVEGGV